MVYTLLRSKCSPQLNALLSLDAEFLGCPEDDPLTLLIVINRLISVRPDGNDKFDWQKTIGEWHTLSMRHGDVAQ